MAAWAPTRSHTSRAMPGVTSEEAGRPMSRSVSPMRSSPTMERNGDCDRCIASACRRVSSNTDSPVVFANAPMTTESRSVSGAAAGGRVHHHHVAAPAASRPARSTRSRAAGVAGPGGLGTASAPTTGSGDGRAGGANARAWRASRIAADVRVPSLRRGRQRAGHDRVQPRPAARRRCRSSRCPGPAAGPTPSGAAARRATACRG